MGKINNEKCLIINYKKEHMNKQPNITQPMINTFNRVGILYQKLLDEKGNEKDTEVSNWITGETVTTTPLIAFLVKWVYRTAEYYERGGTKIKTADFDRIRYFIAREDSNAYSVCID